MRRGRRATVTGSAAGRPAPGGRALRTAIVLGAACGLVQAPLPAGATAVNWLSAYRTDPDARAVRGSAAAGAGAPLLGPGTYVDTVSAGERKYYRVALDATSNAYVSAVLAPPPGSRVQAADGIRVSLKSADGAACSVRNDITFGGVTPLPAADYATRRIGQGRECQEAGEYLYTVEWIGDALGSAAKGWTVELKYMSEPGLRAGTPEPVAPAASGARTPAPERVRGTPRAVTGGSGFNDAHPVGHGVWKDTLRPGDSRFYKVPVDWGRRLTLDAEFGGTSAGTATAVDGGIRATVFNTARGFVADTAEPYRGRPAGVSLDTAPAAFANRLSDDDDISGMRFSGMYYVRVTLDRKVARALPVTLRIGVAGEPQRAPDYRSDPVAAGFGITEDDREAAQEGRVDDDTREALMTAVGFTGIGLGSALLLVLLGWTASARLARPRGRHASGAPSRAH
ncbi:hypothetical protein [Streptomyces sp. NPDC020141]|uniref:hypothetical protein n=1 Tax=Streptomyces sp. NPDC020141 TaxID=3365065 RepID=UPI0037A21DC6